MNKKTGLQKTTAPLVLLCLLQAAAGLSAQSVLRSGSLKDPALEAPLSAEAKKYEPLLNLSNRALEGIMQGKFDGVYDGQFSEVLREDVERNWLTWQLEQIRELYGDPTGFGKLQWWFQEEKSQGRVLVHSIKIMRYGRSTFKYVFTAHKRKPGILRGFRWVAPNPPRSKLLESSTRQDSAALEAGEVPPVSAAESYPELKKVSRECLKRLKDRTSCRDFFSKLLKRQMVGIDFEKNFTDLNESAGAILSEEPVRWELHATEFPNKRILTIRNLVRHERGQVWYVFSVYSGRPDKLVGFQVRPARMSGKTKTEYFIEDGAGNKKRVR